jgi:hypothetical protein
LRIWRFCGKTHRTQVSGWQNPAQRIRIEKESSPGVVQEGANVGMLHPLKDVGVMANSETNRRLIMKDGVIYKNTL